MDNNGVAKELVAVARLLSVINWDDPAMPDALDVLEKFKGKLLSWLDGETRVSWKVTGPTMGSSLNAGLGGALQFSAQEDRQRGGGYWQVTIYANIKGEVVTSWKGPMDRSHTKGYSNLKWSDLNAPKKVFDEVHLPRLKSR